MMLILTSTERIRTNESPSSAHALLGISLKLVCFIKVIEGTAIRICTNPKRLIEVIRPRDKTINAE
jgi:hypothetical protein